MTSTDPVCGMPVPEEAGVAIEHSGRRFQFCTEFCKEQFLRNPHAYAKAVLPRAPVTGWAERRVAYFSMEIALDPKMPTYSGGLGVLAGDTLRSAADLQIPLVGVSLIYWKGYFRQEITRGGQSEQDASWDPESRLSRLKPIVTVKLENRHIHVRAWQYDIVGSSGYLVPIVLLDTTCPENVAGDRRITDHLYGGDDGYRLMQEAVLGIGGIRVLRALGCSGLRTFHLNEGHAALAPLELLRTESAGDEWDFQSVRRRTVFTTHTPVAAGHDQFDGALARRLLGAALPDPVFRMLVGGDRLNMTQLALNLSHYVNGVALRHREVSSKMFPHYEIHQITNGVHSRTWTGDPFRLLFDRYIPGWRQDPSMLHNATALPPGEVYGAHERAKADLLQLVAERSGRKLRPEALTIGFARRATAYKRAELILRDLERLRRLARHRPLQLLFAGKAHPRDEAGKAQIRAILAAAERTGDEVPIVYLAGYDLGLALTLVSGSDLWLNTPLRPLEASGTSGMKAAHNGVPSFSVLDGWWREGCVEGVTGWSIGGMEADSGPEVDQRDAAQLYDKLERVILPLFYGDRDGWIRVMQQAIALNASFFNTHRMVRQYLLHAYGSAALDRLPPTPAHGVESQS